jgi:uncharacterized protein YwbE
VLHNDDTSMRVLHLARAPDDKRTGVFTSGVVSVADGRRIALYFTGRQHAGENVADVLERRAAELPAPVQMCGSSSNTSAYPEGVKILLANCLAHGRRQFVEIMANFPSECRFVLEQLGSVYHNDALARRGKNVGRRAAAPSAAERAGHGRAARMDDGAVGRRAARVFAPGSGRRMVS